ncbi:MFS transporter [Oxalobacteraceae bacterium]|nr:MFS transporter [Oxalobacteraceae bacterium]
MNDDDTRNDGLPGRIALLIAHCAGMVDLVALPVWIGTLITRYGFDPQHAGALVTLFLLGAVCSSLYWAPRFHRVATARVATWGFGVAAAAFGVLSYVSDFHQMAALHVVAGAATGAALSVTHGTIGRSSRPHRLFALAGLALAVFGIEFLGLTPGLVAAIGGPALFKVFTAVMIAAALTCACAFPQQADNPASGHGPGPRLSAAVWFVALGVSCMGLVQAMMFSFVERIGADRGFTAAAITGVLVTLGFVNLVPAPLAGWLERLLPARQVVLLGPVVQAAVVLTICYSSGFAPYAAATAVLPAVMIFFHTFAFGLLAQLDPAGRALSATPAMLMAGAAIGPILGGTLVQYSGYASLGSAAALIAIVGVFCFAQANRVSAPALS